MYFRICINSHAKKQNIWIFIFSSCFSFQVLLFLKPGVCYKLQLFANSENFTTTKYIWCQMLKSQINCNNITVTVISWLWDMKQIFLLFSRREKCHWAHLGMNELQGKNQFSFLWKVRMPEPEKMLGDSHVHRKII